MQLLKTEALIVHSIRWSDTSKIVHLFTEKKGYIKAIARGALRPKSPFRGVLENLNQIQAVISIREGRGLQIVSQADLSDSFSNIRENLESTAIAYSIVELIKAVVHYNEETQSLFRFSVKIMESLNKLQCTFPQLYLDQFIIFLSDYLGFGWNLTKCRLCGKEPQKFPILIDIPNGGIVCANCATQSYQNKFHLTAAQWKLVTALQKIPPEELPLQIGNLPDDFKYQTILDILLAHLNYHTEQTLQLKSLKMYLP